MKDTNVIVIGGGIAGCLAAKAASKSGMNVTLIESRSFLGYETNATNKTWIKNGRTEYELPILIGSSKKYLMRQMLDNHVVPLLTSQVAAIAVRDRKTTGVLIANKFGIQYLSGNLIIDTTSDSRAYRLLNSGCNYQSEKVNAHYSFEMNNIEYYFEDAYKCHGLGIVDDCIHIHSSPFENRVSVEFGLEVTIDQTQRNNFTIINNKAKMKAYELVCWLEENNKCFKEATLSALASEAFVENPVPKNEFDYENIYSIPSSLSYNYSTQDLEEMSMDITKQVEKIVEQMDCTALETESFISGKTKLLMKDCKLSDFDDNKMKVKLKSVEFDFEKIAEIIKTQAIVCGAGTAGSMAIRGLLENNINTAVIEANSEFGGTSVVGNVAGYWHGYRKGLNELVDSEVQKIADKVEDFYTARIIYNQAMLSEKICNCYSGTMICGTILSQNTVKGVVAADENGLFAVKALVTIDCTGDADLVYLAKLPYSFGDQNDGLTQSYSQWGIDHQTSKSFFNAKYLADFDVLYNDKYSELLRGIYLAHGNNSDINFSEMLTVRESRRMLGEYTLKFTDIYNNVIFDDCVAITSTPFDTHGVASSIFSPMGFTVFNHDEVTARIPYRCYIPKNIDGMLVGAKAFSATRDAASMCRMNADLRNAAYALANAASIAINDHVSIKKIDIKKLQDRLRCAGLLPDIAFRADETASLKDIAQQIIDGRDDAVFKAMLINDEQIVNFLKPQLDKNAKVNKHVAKVLAWFGDGKALDSISDNLLEIISPKYTTDAATPAAKSCQYILANQYISLLYKSSNKKYSGTLAQAASIVRSGGKIAHASTAYHKSRIDCWRIPHYEQILILAKAITRLPHPDAITPLEKLLSCEEIGGYVTPIDSTNVKPFFSSYLELHVACALARCGSKVGTELLTRYIGDDRYMLSQYAQLALDKLNDEDFGGFVL